MRRIIGLAAALAASLMLSACLISETPLLTAANARATPLAPGSYDACQTSEEGNGDCKLMQVSRNEQGLYKFSLTDEGENETTLGRFRALGANAFAAQMWGDDDNSYHYFVAEKSAAAFSLSMISCEELPKALRDGLAKSGDMDVEDDATVCKAKTLRAVTASAKAYRKTAASKKERLVLTPVE